MNFTLIKSKLSERRLLKFEESVFIVEKSLAENEIRNVVYNDVKSYINRACDEAFSSINGYDFKDSEDEIANFCYDLNVNDLHSIFSAVKKVEKFKGDRNHTVFAEVKALTDELLPLAEKMKSLKEKIVKGRVLKPVVENPDKTVRTCPCCLRSIALNQSGLMVHHGFKRPGDGWQTESCYGIQFEPLERSDKGLDFMIDLLNKFIVSSEESLEKVKVAKELLTVTRDKKSLTLKEGDEGFDKLKRSVIANIESEIRIAKRDLILFKSKKQSWLKKE